MINILGKELEKEQEQQLKIILLLLVAVALYYFTVYLPQEEIKKLEMQIQTDINKLQTIQPAEYSSHLTKLQSYLRWKDGTEFQQSTLENKKERLNQAIQWLQIEQANNLQQAAANAQRELEETKRKKEEKAKNKKLHWERKAHNWADEFVQVYKSSFKKGWDKVEKMYGEKDPPPCDFGANYVIHFPPYCWNKLTNEQKNLPGIKELNKSEELIFTNKEILEWERKTLINPARGEPEPKSGKDNNALFYGAPGTGKTSITKRLCLKVNQYPMIELKGSSLTATLDNHDAGIQNLQKFIYTISDITWNLVDNFGFNRASDGEVRYILFVDEANQIEQNTFSKSPTYLMFLKECIEGNIANREHESNNLWIFATNYLNEVDKAVYRPGRLSNPLDFSWTLGDFYEHAKKAGIFSQFPQHWKETTVLKRADNEFVNKFSIKSFHELFLPFWRKFISHPETQKDLPEIKSENATEENPEQPGIQLGEFFEFFWNLKETEQLQHFNGKWESPKDDKLEDTVDFLTNTVGVRIDETNDLLQQIGESINNLASSLQSATSSTIQHEINQLNSSVAQIRNKLNM